MNPLMKLYQIFNLQKFPFIYVDCGARGEKNNQFIDMFQCSKYIGFDSDEKEVERLKSLKNDNYIYFPIALGKDSIQSKIYITKNPACVSLLKPNILLMERFMECGSFFKVLSTNEIQVQSLDKFLPSNGISSIDILELDTQGSELDILNGGIIFTEKSILAIQVEVEFNQMYIEQPLFSHIDNFLRKFNFYLFDLSRYKLKRNSIPENIISRPQLMWGHAFYLKNYETIPDNIVSLLKLSIISSYWGFHDYSLEILNFLIIKNEHSFNNNENIILKKIRNEYIEYLGKRYSQKFSSISILRDIFKCNLGILKKYLKRNKQNNYFIKD